MNVSSFRCIYCSPDSSPLPEGTRREHIILSSLGGSLRSSKIVCNSCQSFFSEGESDSKEGIDSAFAKNFGIITAHLGISGTTRDLIDPNTGEKIKLGPGGKPEIAGRVTFLGKESEKMKYEVRAPTKDAAKRMLSSTTKAPRDQINQVIDKVNVQQQWLNNQLVDLKMGGGDIFACAAKMVFNYLGYCTRNEQLALSPCFNNIRNFISRGPHDNSYLLSHYNLIATEKIDKLFPIKTLPEFHHMIAVSLDDKNNKVYGFLRLFGSIEYGFELSNNYVGESASYVHIRNSAKEENYPPTQDTEIDFALITPSDFRSPISIASKEKLKEEKEAFLQRINTLIAKSKVFSFLKYYLPQEAERLAESFISQVPQELFGKAHLSWIKTNLNKFLDYVCTAFARSEPKFKETKARFILRVVDEIVRDASRDFLGKKLGKDERRDIIKRYVAICAESFPRYFSVLNRAIRFASGESHPPIT